MKRVLGVGLCVWLLLLTGQAAQARPHEGWSAMGGFASFTSRGEFTDGLLDGETFEIKTSGYSIGADYQFALSDRLSLNPILMTSGESATSDELDVATASHGSIGAQIRYWWDAWFLGGQIALNTENVVLEDERSDPLNGSSIGIGFVGGWETASGWFVTINTEGYNVSYKEPAAADTSVGGIRIQGGYRWILDQDASSKTEVK